MESDLQGDHNDNANLKSANSSNLLLNKKTRTYGNIGGSRRRLGKGKSVLTQKAFEVAEKAKSNVIKYANLFVNEGIGFKYTDHYKMIKKLGQGGCGEVFMVMHLATDQIRAMKVVSKKSDKVVHTVFDEIKVL